jgi:hypothetical protein
MNPKITDMTAEQCNELISYIPYLSTRVIEGYIDWAEGKNPGWISSIEAALRIDSQDVKKKISELAGQQNP